MLNYLLTFYACCMSPKVIATAALSGVVLAQEIPPGMDWAKLPIEVACVGALFWVVTRTMPNLFDKQIEAQKQQHDKYASSLGDVLKTQENSFATLAEAITAKVDAQMELIRRCRGGDC